MDIASDKVSAGWIWIACEVRALQKECATTYDLTEINHVLLGKGFSIVGKTHRHLFSQLWLLFSDWCGLRQLAQASACAKHRGLSALGCSLIIGSQYGQNTNFTKTQNSVCTKPVVHFQLILVPLPDGL